MHVQRLKLCNYEGNTQELHSLVCSIHNIGMSKGYPEKEIVRGSFVIRIEVCGSAPDNGYVLPTRLHTNMFLLFISQTHRYKFSMDNS